MDDDIELQELFKRLGKTIIIILVFASIFCIVLVKKFYASDMKEIELIKEKKDLVILLRKNTCPNCNEIKKELKNLNIEYSEVKTDMEKYYASFLKELEIVENDIVEPTIINIKAGEVSSILVDINDLEELREYLNNIEIIN